MGVIAKARSAGTWGGPPQVRDDLQKAQDSLMKGKCRLQAQEMPWEVRFHE